MATTGWLGEQTVHQWGGWGTRFTTNVYISGIRRYSDHVDVSGTIYLYCKSNGAYSVWYDWNITSWSMGNNLGQIKERTYTNNILNRSWGKNFTVRINCSNSATSATFNAGFSDSNMGGRDKYWTIYFDRYATAPSGITSTSSYTEYSTITTSCSGIKWGQGYSNRKLTCTASYTFNGKTENFTLGTWTDGATSKTVTKSDFNFPADLNVSIKWVASTNVGSTTSTSQVRVGQTYPAPNLSEVNIEGSSPSTYKLNATVTGINYGENYSKREANLYFDYTIDGISYSTLLSSISDGSNSITVEYDATAESEPWKFIPDDEKGILRLVVDNGHRTSTKSSAQIYCQPQYEAYIIESIPDSEKEKSEIYTGKNIQIQDAPKDAPLADFKLYGNTEQNILSGKNLAKLKDGTYSYSAASQTWNIADGVIRATRTDSTHQGGAINIATGAVAQWAIGAISDSHLTGSGGTYTLTFSRAGNVSPSSTSTARVCIYGFIYDDDGGSTSGNGQMLVDLSSKSSGTYTLNLAADKHLGALVFYSQYISYSDVEFKVQLEQGTATSFEPYVGGTPSPNPDYPQPIQVVTGLQTVEIVGKNLFDKSTEEGGWLNNTGGISKPTSTSDKTSAFIHVIPNTSYTLSSPGYYLKIAQYDSSKTFIKIDTTGNNIQSNTITTEANTAYIRISYGNAQSNPNVMFEFGSTSTSYAPYSKQSYEINLGKNLFNRNDVVNGIPSASDGSIVSTSSVGRTSDYIPVSPNTVYSHTGHPLGWAVIAWYKADKSFIKRDTNSTITSPSEAAYARVSCAQGDLGTCQFEAGKPTTYAPYFEPIKLCKIGEYQDYIWKDGEDWKVHRNIGRYEMTGQESMTWEIRIPRMYINDSVLKNLGIYPVYPRSQEALPTVVTSKFTAKSFNAFYTNAESDGFAMSSSGKNFNFGVKTWTSESEAIADITGTIIYYALATPTDTTITDQTLIEQLEAIRKASLQNGVNNITNIAISPNLTGDIEITYYTKWQDTIPATLYSNGKNGTGQFKQIRRIGTK